MLTSKVIVKIFFLASIISSSSVTLSAATCPDGCFNKRWIYWRGDITTDLAGLQNLIEAASKAGYNGIALNTSDISFIMDPVKAEAIGKKIIAAVQTANSFNMELIPVGANPELPTHKHQDLREAFPVESTYKVYKDGAYKDKPQAIFFDTSNKIENSGFEDIITGDSKWRFDDFVKAQRGGGEQIIGPKGFNTFKITAKEFADSNVTTQHKMARLWQTVRLKPNKPYRLTFKVRSDGFENIDDLKVQIWSEGGTDPVSLPLYALATEHAALGRTTNESGDFLLKGNNEIFKIGPDWQTLNLQFNSGDLLVDPVTGGNEVKATVYMGTWSLRAASSVYIDDVTLREIGISHRVTRSDYDVIVKSFDNQTTFTPTIDYSVDEGTPDNGEAIGKRLILKNTSIRDHEYLKVKWRQSGEFMFTGTVPGISCPNNDFFKFQKALWAAQDAVLKGQTSEYYNKSYFLYYDEIRMMNLEKEKSGCPNLSARDYLHHMVRGIKNDAYAATGPVEILVWNDMFDPFMNARPRYFQVKGPLFSTNCRADESKKPNSPQCDKYAQAYYPLTDEVIVNWTDANSDGDSDEFIPAKRMKSLKHFRDFKQVIAIYYDNINRNVDPWMDAVKTLEDEDVDLEIDGLMYTTWKSNYQDIEAVADKIRCGPYGGKWPGLPKHCPVRN